MNQKKWLKPIQFIGFFAFLLFFFSCQQSEKQPKAEVTAQITQESLTQIWRLADIEMETAVEDEADDLLNEAVNNVFLEEGFMLCFFPNGEVTELLGYKFNQGRWRTILGKTAIEINKNSIKDTLKILDLSSRKGKPYLAVRYEGVGTMEFQAIHTMLEDYKNDPFYPDNNRWRIKPTVEETDLELKNRLRNYVRHVTLILKAAMARDSDIISFGHSQGIIKIYNGGIGIVKQKRVPKEWMANFFNEEQAMQARKFYRKYLLAGTYKGASSGSWVEDDYKILLGLYKRIDEDLKEVNEEK